MGLLLAAVAPLGVPKASAINVTTMKSTYPKVSGCKHYVSSAYGGLHEVTIFVDRGYDITLTKARVSLARYGHYIDMRTTSTWWNTSTASVAQLKLPYTSIPSGDSVTVSTDRASDFTDTLILTWPVSYLVNC